MELMTTYVTAFSRSLTSYSYMIGTIVQKLFSRTYISCINHCGQPIEHDYGSHCDQPISVGYRGHFGLGFPMPPRTNHCG